MTWKKDKHETENKSIEKFKSIDKKQTHEKDKALNKNDEKNKDIEKNKILKKKHKKTYCKTTQQYRKQQKQILNKNKSMKKNTNQAMQSKGPAFPTIEI